MSENVLQHTNVYNTECTALRDFFSAQGRNALCEGFLVRWQSAHAAVLKQFEHSPQKNEEAQEWEQLGRELMQLRARMVSAIAQGLKNESNRADLLPRLKAFLKTHDALFIRIMESQREMLRKEFTDAKIMRQAIGAYAHSARQMGDPKLW